MQFDAGIQGCSMRAGKRKRESSPWVKRKKKPGTKKAKKNSIDEAKKSHVATRDRGALPGTSVPGSDN